MSDIHYDQGSVTSLSMLFCPCTDSETCRCDVSLSPGDKPTQHATKINNQERESPTKCESASNKEEAKLNVIRTFENGNVRVKTG